jgi:prepilin-type N-terminal cleavage/methylation domain-containing protein
MITRLTARLDRARSDDGFTMIEVVVTMVIMAVVLVIFSAGIAQVFGVESKVEAASNSQSSLSIAFQKLDRQIRYATGISTPGPMQTGDADPVVEFLTTNTGANICTQLRLDVGSGQLLERTWTQSPLAVPPIPTPDTQPPLASGFLPPSTTSDPVVPAPFTTKPTSDGTTSFNYQRLEINLTAIDGTGQHAVTRQSDVIFTALNTDLSSATTGVCTEARKAEWT